MQPGARPVNNPYRDIQRKLRVHPEWFLVGILDGQIVASVMAGYEGHRGWLNYVAVAPGVPAHAASGAPSWPKPSGCPATRGLSESQFAGSDCQ